MHVTLDRVLNRVIRGGRFEKERFGWRPNRGEGFAVGCLDKSVLVENRQCKGPGAWSPRRSFCTHVPLVSCHRGNGPPWCSRELQEDQGPLRLSHLMGKLRCSHTIYPIRHAYSLSLQRPSSGGCQGAPSTAPPPPRHWSWVTTRSRQRAANSAIPSPEISALSPTSCVRLFTSINSRSELTIPSSSI